jgi:1-acyl-sn-glycerol-3-phosphate acyltransferase
MSLTTAVVNATLKRISRIICQVDDSQLSYIPASGPLLLVTNHINFLDAPLLYTHLQPRPVTGFVKSETWENPAMALLFTLWEGIPLRRGEADLNAIRLGLKALGEGKILAVAPEGTRSGSGKLGPGHPGVVLMALQSQAPILPVAYYGGEKFRANLARLRRTPFRIEVGSPFKLRLPTGKTNKDIRRQMTDEIMYQLAALLPPEYRGVYSNFAQASDSYLFFDPPNLNNLHRLHSEINPTSHAVSGLY